jgi:ribonuclease HII
VKSKKETNSLLQYHTQGEIEAGCDEAGRGCLAGPVFAAAVILPPDYSNPDLNDSKQLSHKKREVLRKDILNNAVSWAVADIDNVGIDQLNILKSSIMAMHMALDKLLIRPTFLLIDGNRFYPYPNIPHKCIIKGDGKYLSIAAASILAKTFRDDYMQQIHKEYPVYNWQINKGYPTKEHRQAIQMHGISLFHRRSFALLDRQLTLELK